MSDASGTTPNSPSLRRRGPGSLGEALARALESNLRSDPGSSGLAEQTFLRWWLEKEGCLISEADWNSWRFVTNHTLEHEVRFRERDGDRRAVKRTWPGSFGFVPEWNGSTWVPRAASAAEYLHRLHLQNSVFGDDIRLEGGMAATGGPFIIGQPPGQFSLVISQPWLEALHNADQFPTEADIDSFMRGIDFEPIAGSLYGWRSLDGTLIVLDAKPDNLIKTREGLLPFDVLLTETIPPTSDP